MEVNINIDRLREDLMNYFGTSLSYNPVALIELTKVEKASPNELIQIALNNNFDLQKYIVNKGVVR